MTSSHLPHEAGEVLLPLARNAISTHLGGPGTPRPSAPAWLDQPGASFVTLTRNGRLRGCIGSLEPWRPLGDDVASNAVSAATRDPRFQPVRLPELDALRIEVSVLSPREPIDFPDEAGAVAALRPGVDGVVLSHGRHRGTFLPQVWDQVPDPARFLDQLKVKAGLPPSWWDDDVRLERYTVQAWEEP